MELCRATGPFFTFGLLLAQFQTLSSRSILFSDIGGLLQALLDVACDGGESFLHIYIHLRTCLKELDLKFICQGLPGRCRNLAFALHIGLVPN